MGFDTEGGRGERAILDERRNDSKPLITPGGDRVVFTNRPDLDISIVNWDRSSLRRLADGFGVAVWTDPATGVEWLYAARDPEEEGRESAHRPVPGRPAGERRARVRQDAGR